jgi:hypothetical protein
MQIIGQAFSNVMGKLYPAISVDKRLTGCIFSVKFLDDTENGNKDFLFKGPYTDPKTFEPSQRSIDEVDDNRGGGEDDSYEDSSEYDD